MRTIMSLALALGLFVAPALTGCGGSEASADPSVDTSVDGAEARALVAQGATLLDVRTPAEWAGGHVEGAVLIPVQEIEARMAEVPRDRPVVVYCASGVRSARATALLREAGYDARDLGGMSRWGR